jgi:hypothetical protein
VIPESVDSAVSGILWAIGQELLRLSFTTEHRETVYLPVDGDMEMCGWYGAGDWWRAWYSKERIADAQDWADYAAQVAAENGTEGIPDDPPPIREELPMPRRAVEEFAELLVRHVRDVAIQSCDLQLLPHSQTPVAKRWRRAAIPFNGQVPPQVLIPDCVDEGIYAFLRAIDQGLLRLSFTSKNDEIVDLVKEGRGTLAERYMANGGWREKYSTERFFDNTRDWTPEELMASAAPRSYHLVKMFDEGRKLAESDIADLEATIGRLLPETYRRYLMTFNGGGPEPQFLDIEGAPYAQIKVDMFFSFDSQNEYRDLIRLWDSVPSYKEKHLFPIGRDNGDSYLVLDLNDTNYGKVCFIDSKEDPPRMYLVANDFDEMIAKLHKPRE